MRLSQFIVENVDRIVDEWEQFAATITPAADAMDSVALRDHAKAILLAASRDMNTAQTASEQQVKPDGMAQFAVAGRGAVQAWGFFRAFAFSLGLLFAGRFSQSHPLAACGLARNQTLYSPPR